MKKIGFTIVEALVIVLLISIVMGVAVAPYIAQKDLFQKQLARTKLQDGLSLVMLYITKDAYTSKSVAVVDNANSDTVTLTKEPALGSADQTIVYTRINNNLTRSVDGGAAVTIASNITQFNAQSLSKNYLIISMQGQNAGQTVVLDTEIALRATPL